jgi:hypothetical protein
MVYGVPSSQDLSSPVIPRARALGLYKKLLSHDQTPSAENTVVNGAELLYYMGHEPPDRVTRRLVRNSPLKQKPVVLLDLLGLDKQSVDDFPKPGYTPEQVKDAQGIHQRKQSTQGQRNLR